MVQAPGKSPLKMVAPRRNDARARSTAWPTAWQLAVIMVQFRPPTSGFFRSAERARTMGDRVHLLCCLKLYG